jgi:hypothetical protein
MSVTEEESPDGSTSCTSGDFTLTEVHRICPEIAEKEQSASGMFGDRTGKMPLACGVGVLRDEFACYDILQGNVSLPMSKSSFLYMLDCPERL